MKVQELTIYPIKSCGGISVQRASVVDRGFEYDRRFMIVDAHRTFISQRKFPRLALIQPAMKGETLVLFSRGYEELTIPLEPSGGPTVPVAIWHDTVLALLVSREADGWLSEFLRVACHLVYLPETSIRPVKQKYRKADEHTSLADAFPFHLTSYASLQELNRRLITPIPMNRFRPNIAVDGNRPFEEDRWKALQIGGLRFRVVKPCARCVTTTVDQTTGIRGTEPLHTLGTFRKFDGDVLFGQNLIHEDLGTLNVGDSISVLG